MTTEEWGECGRVAYDDGKVLGFVKYAPPAFFPQARHFPAGPPSEDAIFMACLHVTNEARHLGLGKLLLHAALRDLYMRGERAVESYAFDGPVTDLPVVSLDFLIQQGFEIERPHPQFPLMRLRITSRATLTENVEAMRESIKLPLRGPKRQPAPYIDSQ